MTKTAPLEIRTGTEVEFTPISELLGLDELKAENERLREAFQKAINGIDMVSKEAFESSEWLIHKMKQAIKKAEGNYER